MRLDDFKPKVSIIIPVYNVSSYLEQCIESVLQQSLSAIEVILVNDCSPDPADAEICKRYAARDERIVYIEHQTNKRQGGARNTGISAAKADYVGFLDSDDFIGAEMYETLYGELVNHDCDVVDSGITYVDEHGKTSGPYLRHQSEVTLTGNEAFEGFLGLNEYRCYPTCWNKLWRKSLFIDNGITFPENTYFEDVATVPQALFFAKKVRLIEPDFYFYRRRGGSDTNTGSRKHIDDFIEVRRILSQFLDQTGINQAYAKAYRRKFEFQIRGWFFRDIIWPNRKSNPVLLLRYFRSFWRELVSGFLHVRKNSGHQ